MHVHKQNRIAMAVQCTGAVTIQKADMHGDSDCMFINRMAMAVQCTGAVTVQKAYMHGDQRCAGALNACS
jgi:hypothetical protein